MLYAGLDLSRQRLDVHVLDEDGRTVEVTAVRPDGDALRTLVGLVARHGEPVTAAIESMNGARFVHDQLELAGWEVEIADAVKVKGLAPLAAKTDRIDARVLAELGPPGPRTGDLAARPVRPSRARAGPVPAPPRPPPHGAQEPDPRHPHCLRSPGPGVRPVRRRRPELLASLAIPEPWATTLARSLSFVDDLEVQIADCEQELRALGADHPDIGLLRTVPGIGWVLGYTIASEIGDIGRFSTPKKLAGYTGLCPIVRQSGGRDDRGPLAKNGPKYLRWALIEAATHASRHPAYRERYERTKRRLGRQRGSKVARVDIARELSTAIWHMLTKREPFAPGRPHVGSLVA